MEADGYSSDKHFDQHHCTPPNLFRLFGVKKEHVQRPVFPGLAKSPKNIKMEKHGFASPAPEGFLVDLGHAQLGRNCHLDRNLKHDVVLQALLASKV